MTGGWGSPSRFNSEYMTSEPYLGKDYDLAILVVLYKRTLASCDTLNSLLASSSALPTSRVRLVVWNNGPAPDLGYKNSIDELNARLGFETLYVETLENWPLSRIYNNFLSLVAATRYLFLDHDSNLKVDYLECIQASDADAIVPHIVANNEIHGPFLDGNAFAEDKIIQLNPASKFLAIGSGLVLHRSILAKFHNYYPKVFDENFALYGVDTSFWFRASTVSEKESITVLCASEMKHSLSRMEDEEDAVIRFRRKERGLDIGIMLRHYANRERAMIFPKVILRRLLHRSPLPSKLPSIRWMIWGLITGKHPRCKENSVNIHFYE